MSDIDAQIAALQALKAQQQANPQTGEQPAQPAAPAAPAPIDYNALAQAVAAALAPALKPAAPAAAPVPVVPNTHPISDRGSPAPNGEVGWRYELTNPIGMSTAARHQMDAELGVEKARKMRLEAARRQASTMRVKFGPDQ